MPLNFCSSFTSFTHNLINLNQSVSTIIAIIQKKLFVFIPLLIAWFIFYLVVLLPYLCLLYITILHIFLTFFLFIFHSSVLPFHQLSPKYYKSISPCFLLAHLYEQQLEGDLETLALVTYSTLCLSMLALLLTVLVLSCLRGLKSNTRSIHSNTAAAMFLSELVFLLGVNQTEQQVKTGLFKEGCVLVFLLPYFWCFFVVLFLLSAFGPFKWADFNSCSHIWQVFSCILQVWYSM